MVYVKMDGDVLDLTHLSAEEQAHLERCFAAYRAGTPWPTFMGLVRTPENPLLRETGGRITRTVWDHPLFQALRDLEDRLGIKQGYLRPGPDDDPDAPICNDEWIPAVEAAARKGVTLPGLHKAIARGDVIARPIKPGGVRLEVNVASLERWKVNETRQVAGRSRRPSPDGVL